ncbi:HAD family hydrolase [Alicyclobacillus sp. SO9]|uniref:HAD family hydrolase n=1 Tax=Alicyclobacillus sp. SO9 TaxID=2665646 RepID=UPI0018E811F3|nr:HAD family hydrolase [Alicyclobacillus sp. SO9]QQE80988.1 HAD family hydrolase [Alicyclobacillus sp. SO9]
MHIEVIFLDIDGTLFYNNEIVPSALEAVEQLQKKGYTLALCTGRSVLHAKPVQSQLNLHYAVYFNGGLTQANGTVIESHPIAPDVIDRMIEFGSGHELPLIFHTETEAVSAKPVPHRYEPLLRRYDFPAIRLTDVDSVNTEPIYQANVMMPPAYDTITKSTFPECYLYRWDEEGVDLQKGGSNKSVGALRLLEHVGCQPEHALHIGDGGNDIGMFQTLGMSVAMGNASPEVKQHAKMTTRPVDEDGVLYAFKHLGLI